MRTTVLTLCLGFFTAISTLAQHTSVAERLGYPEDAKLLILHADDLGVAHSENSASIDAMEQGPVNSASIMVPCPWFPEIAAYARENTSRDFGLHLTLTSEWNHYKWGPVTSRDSVPGLVNPWGYFFASVDSVVNSATAAEVEIELRKQVRMALQAGIDVTHLDAHMGAALATPDFVAAYMKIGEEFNLPVLLDPRVHGIPHDGVRARLTENTVVLDKILIAGPADYQNGMEAYYTAILKNLEPGLNCLLMHLAYNNEEMKAVCKGHDAYGADWRQADYDFFTSEACRKILEAENIVLVTWRELRDKITRSE